MCVRECVYIGVRVVYRSGLHDGAVLPLPLLVFVLVAVLRRRALDELKGLQHGAGVRQLRFPVDTPANQTCTRQEGGWDSLKDINKLKKKSLKDINCEIPRVCVVTI